MNDWLPQASYPCGRPRYLLTDVPPQPNSPPTMSSAQIDPSSESWV
ncbi:unnamed protein product [Brassica napus]|uniref:(rape) hypothetical protein n=1 Tax=Brassica napus TaxID=3708 RepID=A0A816SDY7_BRANA|nr:unnamed protein product [Brassica napus]